MYSAHFDESGTPDRNNRVLTVAGFVSSVKKWARFELEWPEVLKDAGLPAGTIFHTSVFARGSPPYEGVCWPASQEGCAGIRSRWLREEKRQ
jgi:hypothetical protein